MRVWRAQVQGKDRAQVAAAGKALGLDGHYIPFSYIEQVARLSPAAGPYRVLCASTTTHLHVCMAWKPVLLREPVVLTARLIA